MKWRAEGWASSPAKRGTYRFSRSHRVGVATTVGDKAGDDHLSAVTRQRPAFISPTCINEAREIFAAPAAVMWRRRWCPARPVASSVRTCRSRSFVFYLFRSLAPVIYIRNSGFRRNRPTSPVAGRVPSYLSFCFGVHLPFQMTIGSIINRSELCKNVTICGAYPNVDVNEPIFLKYDKQHFLLPFFISFVSDPPLINFRV